MSDIQIRSQTVYDGFFIQHGFIDDWMFIGKVQDSKVKVKKDLPNHKRVQVLKITKKGSGWPGDVKAWLYDYNKGNVKGKAPKKVVDAIVKHLNNQPLSSEKGFSNTFDASVGV